MYDRAGELTRAGGPGFFLEVSGAPATLEPLSLQSPGPLATQTLPAGRMSQGPGAVTQEPKASPFSEMCRVLSTPSLSYTLPRATLLGSPFVSRGKVTDQRTQAHTMVACGRREKRHWPVWPTPDGGPSPEVGPRKPADAHIQVGPVGPSCAARAPPGAPGQRSSAVSLVLGTEPPEERTSRVGAERKPAAPPRVFQAGGSHLLVGSPQLVLNPN